MLKRFRSKLAALHRIRKSRKMLRTIVTAKGKRNIFLMQTPTHTNIGDHAIAKAEIEFLKSKCPEYTLIEINQDLHFLFITEFSEIVSKEDVIVLHGGGNFGNQYIYEEEIRRSTIIAFPNNKIVIFPQTIYYTDDEKGRYELKKTIDIASWHTDLSLLAREKLSFELMKQYFPTNKILLTPDIVLSLNNINPKFERSGLLMVLRNDEEKILTDEQHEILDSIANTYFKLVTYSDMHWDTRIVNTVQRDSVLAFKFKEFKLAELVITDRLHGMVLAAITQTPCIAFSNYNQKVAGTYEWIKDLNHIRYINFSDEVENEIRKMMMLERLDKVNTQQFDILFNQIRDLIHG